MLTILVVKNGFVWCKVSYKNLTPSSHNTFFKKLKTHKSGIQGNNPTFFHNTLNHNFRMPKMLTPKYQAKLKPSFP